MPVGRVKRVLLIGLDCAAPQFVFGAERFDLPNLQALAAAGCWGLLASSDPPITVPAWASMMSSKDPGTLGCYGFRNRRDYSYEGMATANATAIREPRVWDILSRQGKKSVVLGVPQTYPPKPLNGWLVSGFLAPDTSADYTYPKSLKKELESVLGEYILDVKDFRTVDKCGLLRRIHALMENRFAAARYLLTAKEWDFFMLVEMGVDRLHHGFWRYCDPGHPAYEPGNPFASAIREYYEAVDRHVGELVAQVGEDTAVLVVSDHGAKRMLGGVCINQWLINEGLLHLKEPRAGLTRFEDSAVDWERTKAWSSGGYYARIFINVAGREPAGCVPPETYTSFRNELALRIEAMTGPNGKPLGNRALKPQDLYRMVNGIAPDLIVYLGDLYWRAVGSIGFPDIYTFENDTGPDDANHDYRGIFIMDDRQAHGGRELQGLHLMDVAPTVLQLLGVKPPPDFQGTSVCAVLP